MSCVALIQCTACYMLRSMYMYQDARSAQVSTSKERANKFYAESLLHNMEQDFNRELTMRGL